LPNAGDVPPSVRNYLAGQLAVAPGCLEHYGDRDPTPREHAAEIRAHFGYRDFADQPGHFRLVRWLYERAWITNQRPSLLFDLATAWLVERKVLLPGVSVLARLVAQVRDRASTRLWEKLSRIPSPEQRTRLRALLEVPSGARQTTLDRLRRSPTRTTAAGLAGALERLRELRSIGVHDLDLGSLPPGRIAMLARFATSARVQAIERMPEDRQLATLLAFGHTAARTACDDVLDIYDDFVETVFGRAERRGTQERMASQKNFDAAALSLREMYFIVFNPQFAASKTLAAVHRAIFERIPEQELIQAAELVGALARPPDDRYYERVIKGYAHVRRFLPLLIEILPFEATATGKPVTDALSALPRLDHRRRVTSIDDAVDSSVVAEPWRRHVFPEKDKVDRHAYTFCVLDQLQQALRRRDVFVNASLHWADPRRLLLDRGAWEVARPHVLRALRRNPAPAPELDALAKELDDTYLRTATNLAQNPAARVEKERGRDTLKLTPLDALPEPKSLLTLSGRVQELLPRIDLPDILLDVAAWTSFPEEFTHISEGRARVDDLETSVCAVLLAEACNVGFEPLVRPGVPALARGRLSWVAQNYVRNDTLVRANARLVDFQTRIPLAKTWGGGEVASADGLRFVVPVRTINARPNPKYFDVGRGVTFYNFLSDQFTGFHGIVIPGTLRDSPYILDGLLEHQTRLKPTQLMTDTAGYSDLIFGLFWLLGFRFSPRLADLGSARLWRMSKSADYGCLNGVARHTVSTKLVLANWDDMLRVAGSLLSGKVAPSEIIRALQAGGRLTTLARAIAELGRIPKTIHLLTFVDLESYRRSILVQLNRQEGRHSLGRAVFHGQRGELRQRYQDGQEDQLGALGLVLNAIVLWNTRYMSAALARLREQGLEVREEDVKRLSPLGYGHINLLGRYHFAVPETVRRGELRPLRDPDHPDERDVSPLEWAS
jgi:TnpA family transposase